MNALAPATEQAAEVAALSWAMFIAGAAVLVLVSALVLVAVLRGRRSGQARSLEYTRSRNLVLAGGVALPVLAALALIFASADITEESAAPAPADAVQIALFGRLWWWEVRYLDADGKSIAITANEIHVPVGRPVRFLLLSDNVIHSFWVPRLHGKVDLIPGRRNELWFVPQEAGIYRGQCAELCGVQHAKMGLLVVAEPEAAFAAWLAHQAAPAAPPPSPAAALGRTVFLRNSCATCHTIRGTPARGELGPDLTHLAARRTLAAATLPLTKGNLGGWIADPQHVKPGSLMPAVPLTGEELQALLAYLASLQ